MMMGFFKIIDLGFGKQVQVSADFDKSISPTLWCSPLAEFAIAAYDFSFIQFNHLFSGEWD